MPNGLFTVNHGCKLRKMAVLIVLGELSGILYNWVTQYVYPNINYRIVYMVLCMIHKIR